MTAEISGRAIGKVLENYAFPVEGISDAEVVEELGLRQPLDTIELKAPQLLVYYYGLYHNRFILSFDKGMGKTITYLAILWATSSSGGKVVLVCSENAKLAQIREIKRHFAKWGARTVFVEGSKPARKRLWAQDGDVYILTYDTLAADMGVRAKSVGGRIAPAWVDSESTSMAFDEWHKKLRNKSSGMFKLLKGFRNRRMIFSSGSAGGKGPHSQWAVLHLCDSKKFSGYWPYVMRHCYIEETYFGKKIEGCKDIGRWRREVSGHIFHRRKDLKDYPPKTRQALEVRMEPWQKKIHDQLKKELIAELPDGEFFASPNVLAMTMKLRQFLVCPKILSPDFGYGAGLEGILADAQDSELTHWVVSTPFRDGQPHIKAFFEQADIPCYLLHGGMKYDEIARIIETWTRTGGVICQTIQFAESYELPAARIMYMLGYLHDPEQNAQAEDRIHRDIRVTPHPVDIYYVKHIHSYEEDIVEAMSGTADNIHSLMHKPLKEFLS